MGTRTERRVAHRAELDRAARADLVQEGANGQRDRSAARGGCGIEMRGANMLPGCVCVCVLVRIINMTGWGESNACVLPLR